MKTSAKIAAFVATLATTFAIGCAAPADATISSSDPTEQPTTPIVDDNDPGIDPNDEAQMFVGYDVDAKTTLREDVAGYVLGKLRDHAFAMLLNKIGVGDGSPSDIDDVLRELQQIKAQLTRTHNELQHSIAASALNAKVTSSIEDMATIRLTLDRFENIARLEKEIALARQSGDEEAVTKLSYGVEDKVQEFVNMFDAGGRMAIALDRLHMTIAGTGFGEDNLIDLYRWKLRASGRNLTNAHSESLATGLAFFEEYEAIAALLTAECNAAVQYGHDGSGKWPKVTSKTCSRDPRANDRLYLKSEAFIREPRLKMPTAIPPGMMIDQGPTFGGLNDTTINKLAYYSIDGAHPWRPTDTVQTHPSVRNVVASLHVIGAADWRLPNDAEVRVLFNGNRPGESTQQHLNRIFGTNGRFAGQNFIWTTRTQGYLVHYNGGAGGQHVNVTTQSGIFINPANSVVTFEARPLFPSNTFNDRARTDEMIQRMWAEVGGGIVVMGNTGQNNLM